MQENDWPFCRIPESQTPCEVVVCKMSVLVQVIVSPTEILAGSGLKKNWAADTW